jgi:hypothetical protein
VRIACHGTSWMVVSQQRRCREPTAAAKPWPSSGEMKDLKRMCWLDGSFRGHVYLARIRCYNCRMCPFLYHE